MSTWKINPENYRYGWNLPLKSLKQVYSFNELSITHLM